MSVSLINNHVLIPAMPCWSDKIRWSRKWQTQIAGGVTGVESRQALRQIPRQTLSYLAFPRTQAEKAVLIQQIRTAMKTGYAVVPLWPRADTISATSSGTTLNVSLEVWPWAEGDKIFIGTNDDFEISTVSKSSGTTITLQSSLGKSWAAGTMVYPLFFGKPTVDELDLISPVPGKIKITVSEIVGSFKVVVAYPNCSYGDDFECYTLGVITEANRTSTVFTGVGYVKSNYTGKIADDTFESYSLGTISSMNGGSGWTGNGAVRTN